MKGNNPDAQMTEVEGMYLRPVVGFPKVREPWVSGPRDLEMGWSIYLVHRYTNPVEWPRCVEDDLQPGSRSPRAPRDAPLPKGGHHESEGCEEDDRAKHHDGS